MKIKKIIILGIIFLSAGVYAKGGSGSHGGDGIIINKVPYVLDLVEFGAHLKGKAIQGDCKIQKALEENFTMQIEENVRNEVLKKIYELCTVSDSAATGIAIASNALLFSWVDLGLMNIKDEESPLNYDPKSIVQLAAREGYSIFIDKNFWNVLDLRNKSALILHEIVYSLLKLEESTERLADGSSAGWRQRSPQARKVVGSLYAGTLNSSSLVANKILSVLDIAIYSNLFQLPDSGIGIAHIQAKIGYNANKKVEPLTINPPLQGVLGSFYLSQTYLLTKNSEISSSNTARAFCETYHRVMSPDFFNYYSNASRQYSHVERIYLKYTASILDYKHESGNISQRIAVTVQNTSGKVIPIFADYNNSIPLEDCINILTESITSLL